MSRHQPGLDRMAAEDPHRAPIHLPNAIQPHGALLALAPPGLHVVHAGGATAALLGTPPPALLGAPAARFLSAEHVVRLQMLADPARPISRPLHAFSIAADADVPAIDAVGHQSGGLLVLELEPRQDNDPADALALVETMQRQIARAETAPALCAAVVDELRAVSGFDRVVIYRLTPEGGGEVIAEACGPPMESLAGLHYPASAMPIQARALYRTNWIRMIPDLRYTPAAIIPPRHPVHGAPLDLSQSVIRSVSAVHRRRLSAMGVGAAMSLSLVVRGQLWGLIACHHPVPRFLPQRLRLALELFAEIVSAQLETRIAAEEFDTWLGSLRRHAALETELTHAVDLSAALRQLLPGLLDLIPAAGVGLWQEGRLTGCGATPAATEMAPLVGWLNAQRQDGIIHTDRLPLRHPPAERFAGLASGLLAVPVSQPPGDYLLWFRPEVVTTLTRPDRPTALTPPPEAAGSPGRHQLRWHAAPWREVELEAATRLQLSLRDLLRQRRDQRDRESASLLAQQAQLQQETARRTMAEGELAAILRRTMAEREAERRRIARELHDTLGQSLTMLQLGLEGLGHTAPTNGDMQQRVGKLQHLAADLGREIHRLAREIRPAALDDLGIEAAIRGLLDSWAGRADLQFDLQFNLRGWHLSAAIETTLYRVLQEALTNVVRHAAARRVGIVLGASAAQVTMIVEDDGQGFPPGAALPEGGAGAGLGLLGMRERLALVGGALEIESAPGHGTTLFIRIPL